MDVYDFLFSFLFCRGSCAELPVDCQFSLEGYWYILVLACSILYMLWGHFNYMISNYFFVLSKPKYQDKMKELLVELSNQLQSSDTSGSIAWSTNDVFAKVMGKDSWGRIWSKPKWSKLQEYSHGYWNTLKSSKGQRHCTTEGFLGYYGGETSKFWRNEGKT